MRLKNAVKNINHKKFEEGITEKSKQILNENIDSVYNIFKK